MKKKKTKTLVFLCGFLVLLLGTYAAVTGYNKKAAGTEAETSAAEEAVKILALEGTVTEMTVTSQDETMEFVLQDEIWSERNNPGYVMKQNPLATMAGVFANLPASHTIEESTEKLEEYGLDKPQYVLTAKTAEGQEAVLYVGMQNTITTEYYVYTDSMPGVYTVGTTSINYFVRNLMDFAEVPTFPEVTEGSFQSLETKNGEKYLKAETLTESAYDMSGILTWYVTAPFEHEYVAHTTTLDTIFSAIEALTYSKAAAYNPDETELAQMGLAEPEKELAFTYTQAAETTETTSAETTTADTASEELYSYHLYIGNEAENGYYYVQEEGSELVLLMSKEALDPVLSYTSTDIVNKYFALINIDSVESIEIVLDDGSEYSMTPPDSEADDEKAEAQKDLYQSIISLHAEKVVESQTGELKMLPLTIKFHRNTEPSLVEIQFAEYDTSYYLAIVDGEGIYLVNKRDYNQYCTDVKAGFEALSE